MVKFGLLLTLSVVLLVSCESEASRRIAVEQDNTRLSSQLQEAHQELTVERARRAHSEEQSRVAQGEAELIRRELTGLLAPAGAIPGPRLEEMR